MPKPTRTADDLPGLLGAACVNLEIDADVQLPIEGNIALAQAQATLALAIAQNDANRVARRTADALETANLIAFYNVSDEDAAGLLALGVMTRDKFEDLAKTITARLGLA
ncbi:hypothetical protein SEA_HIRKO_66 [Arthrobacter phage Hirko]|nr:hypothetical protein SEA_HIRKO_66 [Arthrobacter phage Hirko]